ncbi:heme ABC transporter ATP-binding protein [Rhodosalinus sp. K401]|uniref:heme ABC transporter ATP-binding protein n=1 Tax=Rhodosalinus sp. K401 TaxID=3239195 RepID=UPI003525D275
MIDASRLTVTLGRRRVLDGLDFRAMPGALTAIVGPNGSGKTTLMRALTGEIAAEGRLLLEGEDPRKLRPWQIARRRGVLAQFTRLAFPFTVLEVVRLGAEAGGQAGAGATARARAALARVDLAGYEGRHYQELSGGEQARAQLARVLAQVWEPVGPEGPRWLFLDEPVASLDIAHQLQVMELARDYARAGGGVIAVMHDLTLTAMFADRVTLLQEGRVAGEGAAGEVLRPELLEQVYGCPLDVVKLSDPARLIVTPRTGPRAPRHALADGGEIVPEAARPARSG